MNITTRKSTINDVEMTAPLFDGYRIFYKQASDIAQLYPIFSSDNYTLEK